MKDKPSRDLEPSKHWPIGAAAFMLAASAALAQAGFPSGVIGPNCDSERAGPAFDPPKILGLLAMDTGEFYSLQGSMAVRSAGYVVYDNLLVPPPFANAGEPNIAYSDPLRYSGVLANSNAYLRGMSDGPGTGPTTMFWRAPDIDSTSGPERPCDIWWDRYRCDPTEFESLFSGASLRPQRLSALTIHLITRNDTASARNDLLVASFLDAAGERMTGAFGVVIQTAPGGSGYFTAEIDLALVPEIWARVSINPSASESPYMGLDWSGTLSSSGPVFAGPVLGQQAAGTGVGVMFAGGDRSNQAAGFPVPSALHTLGSNDYDHHLAANGESGAAGLPATVNNSFDAWNGDATGDPATTSQLDVLGSGRLFVWNHTATAPFSRSMPRAWSMRLHVVCLADVNFDGFVDAIDYDQFIGDWLVAPANAGAAARADINNDGFADAIDFDEYVTRFLQGC